MHLQNFYQKGLLALMGKGLSGKIVRCRTNNKKVAGSNTDLLGVFSVVMPHGFFEAKKDKLSPGYRKIIMLGCSLTNKAHCLYARNG